MKGGGLALAGIILGVVGVTMSIVGIVMSPPDKQEPKIWCLTHEGTDYTAYAMTERQQSVSIRLSNGRIVRLFGSYSYVTGECK